MGKHDTKIADAILLLAKDQSDPHTFLTNLSPLERLHLSQGLGDAFNTLDRLDQAFADLEEQGHGRLQSGVFCGHPMEGGSSCHEPDRSTDWA
ncbi:MAG: hypothetical protein HQL63_09595 [Magnetococcales bacterium]|nr:hypothetical protein [Magnetococcales bacterium]